MFKTSMEVKALKQQNLDLLHEVERLEREIHCGAENRDKLNDEVKSLKFELSCKDRECKLSIEEAKNEIRKEMQKDLISSDISREQALAKLSVYEKMDNKDQIKKQSDLLEKAVEGLCKAASKESNIKIEK